LTFYLQGRKDEVISVYTPKPKTLQGFLSEDDFDLIPIVENIEQADNEHSLNWAIDMNFFMFATVMGVCMPAYQNRIPLISARFYSLYTEDFLVPLSTEW